MNRIILFNKIALFTMVLLSCGMAEAQLIAHFPFDGNTTDQSVNNYSTLVNTANLTNDRFNTPNRAYYFNGTGSNIELSSNFPNVTSLTIAFWFKPDGPQSNDTGYIFWEGDGTCGKDISVAYLNQKIYIKADKNGASLNGMINQGMVDLSQISASMNGWYHFAWVMEPNQSKIYINGQYQSTASVSGSGVGTHYHPTFGCLNDANSLPCSTPKGHFLKGSLDEFRMYSTAMSAGGIDSIFQDESVNTGIKQADVARFSIYPNPASDGIFNLSVNKWVGELKDIKAYDILGREISFNWKKTGNNETYRIFLNAVPDGIYFLKIVSDGPERFCRVNKK